MSKSKNILMTCIAIFFNLMKIILLIIKVCAFLVTYEMSECRVPLEETEIPGEVISSRVRG